ncbi:cellular nucleic acid-binding protein-like [Polistes fuscatus]|uniref:cellular nucleic acid-binding protein-like n=1 Tax=Polistes fuscatus TaxID=30207 RepID=UPI001CA9C612|nr:cellular nucleic acid-binding protein-like [Polistes fuscatus]XP_043496472.1 cellular nucleic acid-binding protein-like [Polistes fuscatus]
MAVCEVEGGAARALLNKGRIRIGWMDRRVKPRLTVPRCYKCLGFGHTRQTCKGPDRGRCCWKCGGYNHVGKDCNVTPKCFLCSEAGHRDTKHIPGKGECAVFRAALEESRKKTQT